MDNFLSKQQYFKVSGAEVIVVDFTKLDAETSDQVMVVGIVTFPNTTVFIKLMGPKTEIIANTDDLVSLIKSIEIN